LGGVWVVCCVVCVLERKREREERGYPLGQDDFPYRFRDPDTGKSLLKATL
jgi:hypothetical protein